MLLHNIQAAHDIFLLNLVHDKLSLSYNPEEAVTIYLAAMEGFYHLQPECDSGLVTIEPYEGAEDWNLPVFTMTFRNPEGGDVQLKVESNCTPLQFRFTETG